MYTPEFDREAEALAKCYTLARARARQLRQQATLNKTLPARPTVPSAPSRPPLSS